MREKPFFFFLAVFLQKRPLRDSWLWEESSIPIRMETSRAREIQSCWDLRMGRVVVVSGPCSATLRRQLGCTASLCFAALISRKHPTVHGVLCESLPGRSTRGPPGLRPRPATFITNLYSPPRAAGTPGVVECQGLFVLFWLAPTWQELIFLLMTPCCEKTASAGRAWVRGEGAALRLCGPKWGRERGRWRAGGSSLHREFLKEPFRESPEYSSHKLSCFFFLFWQLLKILGLAGTFRGRKL